MNPFKQTMETMHIPDFSIQSLANAVFGKMDCSLKHAAKLKDEVPKAISYTDLRSFAIGCKRHYPQIVKCSVVCEILETEAAFRITQTMFDEKGEIVKSIDGKHAGRIVIVSRMDVEIHSSIGGKLPTEFSFEVS